MRTPVRANIRNIKPYVPGKPIELLEREIGAHPNICKLASNENLFGISPLARDAVRGAVENSYRYPDDASYELRGRLANALKVPMASVRAGNGSSEIIYLLGLALLEPSSNLVASKYCFNMPKIVASILGCETKEVPLRGFRHDVDGILAEVDRHTKFVYLDLPMNPIGTTLSEEEFEYLLERLPEEVLLVCDEAYWEFAAGGHRPESLDRVREGKNVVVLRTFSKVYGLAGLRVGYCVGDPELMDALGKVSLAFSVNRLAQVGAMAALEDGEHVRRTVEATCSGKRYLYKRFEELQLPYITSETNFVTVDAKQDGRGVSEALERRGIIVRPLAGYGLPSYLRVTVGTAEQNTRFIETLSQVLAPPQRK